jgi:hypothetical protein
MRRRLILEAWNMFASAKKLPPDSAPVVKFVFYAGASFILCKLLEATTTENDQATLAQMIHDVQAEAWDFAKQMESGMDLADLPAGRPN